MPTNRGNGFDVFVAGDGRGRDEKGARQSAGPYRAAPQRLSGVPVPGKGLAGYSHELLKGALIYSGRGIPVFPCEPQGKSPYGRGLSGGDNRRGEHTRVVREMAERAPQAIPTGERSGLLVLDVDALRRARTRWLCSNSPAARPRRPCALRQVGEGCTFTSATLPYNSYGRRAFTRSR
jgi:hypothetical protein